MKKVTLVACLFSLFSSLIVFGQVKEIKETKEEAKITDLIASLPVVMHADNYVRKVTKANVIWLLI